MYCTLQQSKGTTQRGMRWISFSVTTPIDAKLTLQAQQRLEPKRPAMRIGNRLENRLDELLHEAVPRSCATRPPHASGAAITTSRFISPPT